MNVHDNLSAFGAGYLKAIAGIAFAAALLMSPLSAVAQGGLDGTFSVGTGTNQPVEAIAVQPDGKILIGGGFTFYNGVASPCLARLNADGTRDASFNVGTGADGVVRRIIVRADGKILIAGDFTNYNGIAMGRLALLEPDGSLNPAFISYGGADGPIFAMALQSDGLILVGGDFGEYQNEERRNIARVYPDGLLDLSFDPGEGSDGFVYSLTPLEFPGYGSSYTQVLVGGNFEHFGGIVARNLAKLDHNGGMIATVGGWANLGSLETDRVNEAVLYKGDSVLIGGVFGDWVNSSNLRMFNRQGDFLYQWNSGAGADGPIHTMAVDEDWNVIIGGGFQHYNGVARHGIAKILANGTLDTSFDPGSGINAASVLALALQDDGRILIGGGFSQYGGSPAPKLVRICSAPEQPWYPDVDGDHLGVGSPVIACVKPPGYAAEEGDACPNTFGDVGWACIDIDPQSVMEHIESDCVCRGKSKTSVFPYDEDFNTSEHFAVYGSGARWKRGLLPGDTATCLYVSDDAANDYQGNQYDVNTAGHTLAVWKVEIPLLAKSFDVSFDWKGSGEPGADGLRVWFFNDNYFPSSYAIDLPSNLSMSGELLGQSTWTHASFTRTNNLFNIEWLVFEWRNNANGTGGQPPAAIDNLRICTTIRNYPDVDGDGHGAISGFVATCGELLPGHSPFNDDNCPNTVGLKGWACDDGDASTVTDIIGEDCVCRGVGLPWNEDFSAGRGGFRTYQGSQTNQWQWGNATGHEEPSWYISTDYGVTFGYSNGSPSVSHLIHDVPPIPATATAIEFAFDRRQQNYGEGGHLQVWLVPTSFTPIEGTPITATGIAPSGRVLLGDYYPLVSVGGHEVFHLPLSYAGQSPRLVFQWQDSGTGNGGSPTYIDNIHFCVKGPGYGDADIDGIADCLDPCPNSAHVDGEPCDDGDPVTIDDTYGNCGVCAGQVKFDEGNLVVMQLDGNTNLTDGDLRITLQEVATAGYLNDDLEIPSSGTDPLIATGSLSGGMLGLSADSTELVFAGYAKPFSLTSGTDTSYSATVPRGIGLVDAGGHYTLAVTSNTAFSGRPVHGATSDGTNLWGFGFTGGTEYFGPGTPGNVANGKSRISAGTIFNNQLYVSSFSNSGVPDSAGVYAVGSGTPTSPGQELNPVVKTGHIGTAGFCFNPAGNVLYVALRITGIQKWVLNGTWQLAYTMTFSGGANGIVADFSGASTVLYFTNTDGSKLQKVTDPGTGSGSIPTTPVLLRNAPGGALYRGLSWAPKRGCVSHTWYADTEGDGLGDPAVTVTTTCGGAPSGYVADNTDSCPAVPGKVGTACDDGDVNTKDDVVGTNCVCAGTYCPIPAFIPSSGTQIVCYGSSFSLDSPIAYGAAYGTYHWSGPGGIQSPNVQPYNTTVVYPNPPAGTYVHTRTASNGCGSATYTLVSTVLPQPVVSPAGGNVSLCPGTGITLTASPGTSYSWYAGPFDLGYHAQSIYISSAGNFKVRIVFENGCQYESQFTNVTMLAPPTVSCGSYGPLCSNGANINLGGSPAGGTWSGTGVLGPLQGTYKFTPGAGTRTLTYTYTNAQGCSASCSTTINVQQPATWYADTDGDGFGDPAVSSQLCGLPGAGWTTDHTDDCPSVFGKIGSTCDDGSSSTIGDVVSSTCVCQGVIPQLAAHVFLQGPYDSGTGLMSDALRALPGFPLSQPYTALGYSGALNETGSISPSVLTVTGNDAIVDWVVIELRSPASPSTIVDMRAALLQRDGDIVGTDGVSPVTFPGASASYHVAVRHRNHLGCMTNTPVTFGTTPLVIDFTNPATVTWGTNARMTSGSNMLLYMGDGNANGQVKYTGSGNDRDPILVTVGSTTPNNTVSGYSGSDTNMNGQVKYTGSSNDRDPILINVGSTTPNNTRTQQLP